MVPEVKDKDFQNNRDHQEYEEQSIDDSLIDTSFDASLELPMIRDETEDHLKSTNLVDDSQIQSILSSISRNIDQENIDPITHELSPRKKPGSLRRAVLKDLTEKYLKKESVEKKTIEIDQTEEDFFTNYTDSPLEDRNFREL